MIYKKITILVSFTLFFMLHAMAQESLVPTGTSGGQELSCGLKVTPQGAVQQVEVSFEAQRLENKKKPDNIKVEYVLESNAKGILSEGPLDLEQAKVQKVNNTFYCFFQLGSVVDDDVSLKIIVTDEKTDKSVSQAVPLEKPGSPVEFFLSNLTDRFKNYSVEGDTIIFMANSLGPVHVIKFSQEFMPAAPPMGNNMPAGPATMQVDTVYSLTTNQPIVLKGEALYFAQSDTTTNKGIGFRVVPQGYPKFKKVEDIARSMIYISTDNEIQSIINGENKKAVLDNFWINAGGSVDVAKRLIKTYYNGVTYANQEFTSYKEGWKTDKGMIHIVFGKPAEINQFQGKEHWVYYIGKKRKRVTFEFIKRNNLFSDNHYELVRSPEYKKVWYEMVESWRNGQVNVF
ncbi:GWxTD domain-containing protein [Flammeovirgaceae bacterium SG7u.111]|nr:GWxTD domain-containing protein [Flammeovirgaceae bacterium SG7u.132]WPO36470.1 GWxTD domain-containing protein [Flammeovirgaceae bacterium SG7u.111]